MAIAPVQTFVCEFAVRSSIRGWNGVGNGKSSFGPDNGLIGPTPRFKAYAGWITLFPSKWWVRLLPVRLLHEIKRLLPRRVIKYRDPIGTFSVFVGEALEHTLRIGDKLVVSRDAGADLSYCVKRNNEIILSAGSVGALDQGGSFSVWQEHESRPIPNAARLNQPFPATAVATSIEIRKPYIMARIREQTFYLLDGDEAHLEPYYVFLARSNQHLPPVTFEFVPRAVYAAGRLDEVRKELIIDAANNLLRPKTTIL